MIKPDTISYRFNEYLTQEGDNTCTVYAFFGCITELLQQATNLNFKFYILREFKKNEIEKTPFRVQKLTKILLTDGFYTTDNTLIKAQNSIKIGKYPINQFDSWVDKVKENIYKNGCGVVVVGYNNNSILKKEKDGILNTIKEYVRNDTYQEHALVISGYDDILGFFELTNSWGDKTAKRFIYYEDLYKIYKFSYFFENITIQK